MYNITLIIPRKGKETMYKQAYSIIAIAALLFTGCGNSEQKTQTTASTQEKASVETVVGTKPQAKQEQSVAIETHGPKEEANIAKIPTTVAPTPLPIKKESTPKEVTQKASIDASKLYASCAGCHGGKGEKKALGKSELIGGWSALKVEEALKEYRSKKRNVHGMGAVMQGQAAKLSDEEIKALGEYISKLH